MEGRKGGHPRIVEAVTSALRDQSGASGLSAVNQHMVGLAEDLRRITPIVAAEPDRRVYLGNSGTDANEAVLRSCRLATGRRRILAFHRGFLDSIHYTGRLYEVGLVADYKLRSRHLLKDVMLAPKMYLKGKLGLFPHLIKNRRGMKRLFMRTIGKG